jgi:RNA-directed DNA polymerase
LAQVAQRVKDPEGLHVRQLGLHASGTKGVAQGGVLSPLLRILSLPAVDRRLEQAQEVTRRGSSSSLDYARCAAALVSLGDASPPPDWLLQAVAKRLREEVATLPGASNEEKSRLVDLAHGEHCSFVGFEFRRVRRRRGGWRAW